MNIHMIENTMADISTLLLVPVLLIIVALFFYAIFSVGHFASVFLARRKNASPYQSQLNEGKISFLVGYPVHNYYVANPQATEDELELFALKQVEKLRIVTRTAPMLGLIATMIPMGPALQALADGNIQGISENLIIAFAAVIWALVIATLTFWPASVEKRWHASEIINIRKLHESGHKTHPLRAAGS